MFDEYLGCKSQSWFSMETHRQTYDYGEFFVSDQSSAQKEKSTKNEQDQRDEEID